jgi:dolichol-phosphate mannosyltransferase
VRRALVTGAAGFVGANLARRLLEDGHDVHLLVRPGSPRWRLAEIEPDAELHEADLEDVTGVAAVVRAARPEWVFHLAARGAYSWQTDTSEILAANVLGTSNLLEACAQAGFDAFVNTGSSSEYGFTDHAPAEDERLDPNSVYAVGKAAATQLCGLLARRDGLRVTTLRLYSVYGPYEEPNRFVPALVLAGLEGRLPPLVSPAVARDFVYVDDVTSAYVLAAGGNVVEPGAVYNVGTGTQVTIGEAVAIARELFGIREEPEWGSMADRAWDTDTWVADSRKIREELGWSPAHSFASGLAELAEWFRASPDVAARYSESAAGRPPA